MPQTLRIDKTINGHEEQLISLYHIQKVVKYFLESKDLAEAEACLIMSTFQLHCVRHWLHNYGQALTRNLFVVGSSKRSLGPVG